MSIAGDIISGVAQVGSSLLTAGSAKRAQRRQMEWDEKFWNQQNEYNSPQSQMKRLQEAGLNPNLVYGGSPGSTAGTAERLKTPDLDPSAHRPIDPQGVMSVLGGYNDLAVKQAQTDNLKAQTQVAQENAILTAQKSYGEGVRNAKDRFDLNLAEDLRDTSLEAAKESLRKLKIDAQYTVNQDERAAIATANSTAQAIESILSMRLGRTLTQAQINSIRADYEVKKLDSRLAKMGVRPTDPFYATALIRLMTERGWMKNVPENVQKSIDGWKKIGKSFGF